MNTENLTETVTETTPEVQSNYLRPPSVDTAPPILHLTKLFLENLKPTFTYRSIQPGLIYSLAVGFFVCLTVSWKSSPLDAIYDTFANPIFMALIWFVSTFRTRALFTKRSLGTHLLDLKTETLSIPVYQGLLVSALTLVIGTFMSYTNDPRLQVALLPVFVASSLPVLCFFGVAGPAYESGLKSADAAFKASLHLSRRNRLKIGIFLLFSHVIWLGGYLFILPGILLFEWHQRNLISLYNQLAGSAKQEGSHPEILP